MGQQRWACFKLTLVKLLSIEDLEYCPSDKLLLLLELKVLPAELRVLPWEPNIVIYGAKNIAILLVCVVIVMASD